MPTRSVFRYSWEESCTTWIVIDLLKLHDYNKNPLEHNPKANLNNTPRKNNKTSPNVFGADMHIVDGIQDQPQSW